MFAITTKDLSMEQTKSPALSIILCSRNDQYMGNSRWRLETALNYVAQNVQKLGREADVEVLVVDWGSEIPLREVLQLSPAAAQLVSFLLIPPEIARELQRDSPFSQVHALNAAARRVTGQYIGRIDQDTLVGERFLRTFFEMHDGAIQPGIPLESVLLFSMRRHIPYRLADRCPSFWTVDRFVEWFGRFLTIEPAPLSRPFHDAGVGIWLLHRNLWEECGGYDERMIYVNVMEVDMISRLIRKYQMVDLGTLVDYDFYHLEHYHPWSVRGTSCKRNPEQPNVFHPNSKDWGLVEYPLEILPAHASGFRVKNVVLGHRPIHFLLFLLMLVSTGTEMAWDVPMKQLKRQYSIWSHRARVAREACRGMSLIRWPRILLILWMARKGHG